MPIGIDDHSGKTINPNGCGAWASPRGPDMVNIHPSPGGFPRGRPALYQTGPPGPVFSRGWTWQTRLVPSEPVVCSAKGCRAPAVWALRWNNPKLHPPERRKTWLACDEHREHLSGFLSARGFLREVEPVPDR